MHNGTVFVGTLNGDFVAVDLNSGSLLWSAKPGTSIYGAAVADSTAVIVGTTGGHIVAMDPATGPRDGIPISAPLLMRGFSVPGMSSIQGHSRKNSLRSKRATGEIIWRVTTDGRIKTTPIGGLGRVFIAQDTRIIQSFRSAR